MKKVYIAPRIAYDDFQLSENIAMCELISTNQARYECAVVDDETGWVIFSDTTGGSCVQTPADGEQICYEIPMENYNVFVS